MNVPEVKELAESVDRLAARLEPALPTLTTVEVRMQRLERIVDGENGGAINPGMVRLFADLEARLKTVEAAKADHRPHLDWKAWSFILGAASAISASVAAIVQALTGG